LARSLSQTKSQGAVSDRILELIDGKALGQTIPPSGLVLDRMFELGIPCRTASALPPALLPRVIEYGSAVTRPVAESNGNAHSLVLLDVEVKTSLVPSGEDDNASTP